MDDHFSDTVRLTYQHFGHLLVYGHLYLEITQLCHVYTHVF